jgi:hypothetical protein
MIVPGTLPHTILVAVVSEPGEWSVNLLVEEYEFLDREDIETEVQRLAGAELLHVNSTDLRLWPRRAGRRLLEKSA